MFYILIWVIVIGVHRDVKIPQALHIKDTFYSMYVVLQFKECKVQLLSDWRLACCSETHQKNLQHTKNANTEGLVFVADFRGFQKSLLLPITVSLAVEPRGRLW